MKSLLFGESRVVAGSALLILAACGGGGGSSPASIGGMVSGLAGSGLVLADNGSDHLAVAGNGSFTFATKIPDGGAYSITVLTQPTGPSQRCAVANGSGQAAGSAVTSAAVTCTTNAFTVGGTVYGLAGSAIQLTDKSTDILTISEDGHFSFSNPVASGSSYAVTISAQPVDLTLHCAVSNGVGTVGDGDVTNLAVRCAKAGRFVYITEHLEYGNLYPNSGLPPGGVAAYAIDATTGGFQTVPGSPFATDKCPCGLSVTPDGRFAYVSSGGTLYPYRIDILTGVLSAVGAGTSAISGSVGIDPQSRFLYVFDPTGNTVSAYTIDPNTGSLMPVPGGPLPTGSKPAGSAFDPSGKFLFVANNGSNSISAYTIAGVTGALTAMAGSPFSAGGNPDTLAVDPSGRFLYAMSGGATPQSSYAIDAAAGTLTPLTIGPVNANPTPPYNPAFFFDPNSNRAYVVAHCANQAPYCVLNGTDPFTFDLWTLAIDDQTGGIIQSGMPQHLYTTDEMSDQTSAQIDPSGKFICARVLHGGGMFYSTFICYTIDSTTGTPSHAWGNGVGSDTDVGGAYPVEVWDTLTIAT